jgi:hypothetical protein
VSAPALGALLLSLALRVGETQGAPGPEAAGSAAAPSAGAAAAEAPPSTPAAPAAGALAPAVPAAAGGETAAPAAKHPAGIEAAPTGIIPLDDNWGFVKLAYGVAGAGLLGYALSLWVRRPRTKVS